MTTNPRTRLNTTGAKPGRISPNIKANTLGSVEAKTMKFRPSK